MRRVLVMTDFSPGAQHAHRFAWRQFPDAQFDLVHVVAVGALAASPPRTPPYLGRNTVTWAALDHERARQAASRLQTLGGGTLVEGNPAEVALDHARSGMYDLIALSTAGRRGPGRLMCGSVAERVVRDSPVPVLTARGDVRRLRPVTRVLVPADSSPHATRALRIVCATWPKADVRLLHVVAAGSLRPPAAVRLGAAASERDVQARLEESRRRVQELGGGTVALGSPTPRILAELEAGDYDLVALGTAGRRGVAGLLFGSTAWQVVRESPVPVLTVRADAGGA